MKKTSFNLNWQFKRVDSDEAPQSINLPHDAMLYEKRDRNTPSAGACGYFPGGAYEYSKTFYMPEDEHENVHILEFEAVYKNASVYINGVLAAQRPYGYTNFYVSMDEHLHFGGENQIKVIADNSAVPNSRWYSGSGIYRNVNLYTGNAFHFLPDGLLISTADNESVAVKAAVSGGDQVKVVVTDHDEVVAEAIENVVNQQATIHLCVPQPRLWDAEHPELYRCSAYLLKDGKEVDQAEDLFGFRTLKWDVKGFYVNGKKTLLRGDRKSVV